MPLDSTHLPRDSSLTCLSCARIQNIFTQAFCSPRWYVELSSNPRPPGSCRALKDHTHLQQAGMAGTWTACRSLDGSCLEKSPSRDQPRICPLKALYFKPRICPLKALSCQARICPFWALLRPVSPPRNTQQASRPDMAL